ncbi:hypothetical protein [Arthrobacter sp. zg-Y1171]|uniref:hypothetical protein n=1 Tax=Arthrobacter sp. zg-Y1171 TaxID=2964610 RepID=UPI0021065263|nr:hypothetical protein [Arthrobacter sp. zg-Y1171]MCQ1993811.1 hypothetical protein [Arthrobacter sp. zg-Y1171]UWX82059.1 hypothetical protein N2L00_01010 [Arthrobacter sp. zg-Y1171]
MNNGANPLIPTGWEFLVTGISAALIILLVVAVVRLARSSAVTAGERLGLLLFCLIFPVLGPICTLVILARRESVRR